MNYKIFDTKRKKEISLEKLNKNLKKIDVIFFGEEHNDSIGHRIELALFRLLEQRYKNVALSLEMFQSDTQLVLDEYLSGLITPSNLAKDGRLWNNYKDYEPLIEFARIKQTPVLAANAPSRYTNSVTRHGLESLTHLSESGKNLLAPLPIDTLIGPYYEKFVQIMGGHDKLSGAKIYQSQNLWDATMAYRISKLADSLRETKILHINGRFHSDEKLGTFQQLRKYAPYLKAINISCFSHEDFEKPQWEDFQELGDYIILTNPNIKRSF
ncbi:ChaN family lipoprotein [Olivibacter sp. SDN3]|uniref:ChaN family lipoprotein n=1 Tax=Olivibacter sp. SDN3 TaxID=2764720 RepID=UPI0021084DD0|nr:ChaN family lipoprotein [Olivibacter sp. SDN3]